MRHRTGAILTFGLGALAAVACQPVDQQAGGQETAVDTAAIEATFDSLRVAFEDHVAAGDFDAQAAIYADDAIFSPPMGPPVRGREAIRTAMEQGGVPGSTLEIDPMDFTVLGPDVVYEYGTSTLTFTPEGADQAQSVEATYFALFRRIGGEWKLAREVLSANAPPPAGGM